MSDLLAKGARYLADVRTTHAARTVTYSRGGASVVLWASSGEQLFEDVDAYGSITRIVAMDWLIRAADLALSGSAVEPAAGDRITDGARIYEVMGFGLEPPWRWSDRHHVAMRVHSKLVE